MITSIDGAAGPEAAPAQPVGSEQLLKLTKILQEYKAGKAKTERRIIASENWWKLRNDMEEDSKTVALANYRSKSGWLHNVITSKHADAMEAYPEPNVLPREQDDKAEATILTSIIPCILEQNDFEQTYSDVAWQKGKTGTGVYKVVWDSGKLNGLGDITISRVNLLNLYWEPGVEDIQKSRYFFHTELVDKDLVEEMYPQTKDKLNGTQFISAKFLYDDSVSTDGKVTVIECYYHKNVSGKRTLQYVKYVNDVVLYATENDTERPTTTVQQTDPVTGQPFTAEVATGPSIAERGLYDHGMYPYDFDPMFPIEGSPCGYGYVDICRDPQTTIDMLNTAFVKNAMVGATPRFFRRSDGGINDAEFLDITKPIVNVNGNLGEDSLREIPHANLDGVYVNFLDRVIQELRETSGNTETSTGSATSGVTSASGIAALQEASGKGSRDINLSAYRSYVRVVKMCIELIRQFYDMPRQFRIIGSYGAEQFITYTNAHLVPQAQGSAFGVDMGYRKPEFDIKVSAQKKSAYTKVSQNELALQFYNLGFFNPQMVDQALLCLDIMDFDGKDAIAQKIAQNGTMYQKLAQYMQLALALAAKYEPSMVSGLSQDIMQTTGGRVPTATAGAGMPQMDAVDPMNGGKEHPFVQKARAQSQAASQPEGGAVTGEAKG